MNDQNLIPFSERSKSEARECGTRGGIASGKTRRFRKTFREALKNALGCEIPKDSPLYKRTLAQMKALGIDGEPTVQDIPVLGMIAKSAKDPTAFAIIRDTIGEKPVETFEDVTPQGVIVLGTIPEDQVKKAKAEHEARQLDNNKKE